MESERALNLRPGKNASAQYHSSFLYAAPTGPTAADPIYSRTHLSCGRHHSAGDHHGPVKRIPGDQFASATGWAAAATAAGVAAENQSRHSDAACAEASRQH